MQKDWVKFYKENQAPSLPSDFARFIVEQHFLEAENVVDIGCGNGRDTYYLGKIFDVIGIDDSNKPNDEELDNIYFKKDDWKNRTEIIKLADIVYSRFFLHAISDKEIQQLLDITPNYFCAEARSIGDEPKLYPEHERNFIDGDWLLFEMILRGFDILYYKKSRGLAKYKNEDPLVVRVIAKKCTDEKKGQTLHT